MQREPMPTGAMKAFIRKETARILESCTRCGKCFEACPMTRYSPALNGARAETVVTDVLSLLREEAVSPQAVASSVMWVLQQGPEVDISEIVIRPTGQLL